MLKNQNILCISSIDWDFIWQGHQEIMASLAAQGNRVLFIENTGVRSATWSDMPRLKHRFLNWRRSVRGFRQERENLYVYSPVVLPLPYARIAQRINRWLIMRGLRRWMRLMRFYSPIAWTFLPTPLAHAIVEDVNAVLLVYYCIDSFAESSSNARKIARSERRMLKKADLVFVTSDQLRNYASKYSNQVHVFPFGVDFSIFEKARKEGEIALPADVSRIPHPRIGYVGGIHRWMNLGLLRELAVQYPRYQIVLVGPTQTDTTPLQGLANVHLLGARSHEQIPHYINAFDVALIPYRLTTYTDHVYPTKMNEYLAMGKPVISTDLREIRLFNARHGNLVSVAEPGKPLGPFIERSLANGQQAVERRIAVAKENSWQVRIAKMSQLIDEMMAAKSQNAAVRWRESLLSVYRTAMRRLLTALVPVVLSAGLMAWTPLPWIVAAPLRIEQRPAASDAIVVFAGGVGESGEVGQGYEERVKQGVELFHRGYAPRLMLVSGYRYVFREAEVMRALAVSLGVPPEAILVRDNPRNTYEQVKASIETLQDLKGQSLLVVSSPYHMRRVKLIFKKQARQIAVLFTPPPTSEYFTRRHSGASLRQVKAILHEYAAIVYYASRHWL